MLFEILMGLLSLIVIAVTGLIIYARWNYGTLEAWGLPVVKPHWLLGSNYNSRELFYHWEDLKRAKELGPIYGVYNGRRPEVFITDPEIIHLVYFKDSDHFANKRDPYFGHPLVDENIEFLNGDKMKAVRGVLSPMLTAGKVKQLSDTVNRLSADYVQFMLKEADVNGGRYKMDFDKIVAPFAIEVIAECLCGIKLENARDPKNNFVKQLRGFMFENFKFDWTSNITEVFPFLQKLISPFCPTEGLKFFDSTIKNIFEGREKSGLKIPDMVNTLMEMRQKCSSEEYKRLGISDVTVLAQALEFFLASYQGTLTVVTYLCYHLVMNPDVYAELMKEVDATLKKSNGKVDNEAVSGMNYLTACITEALRITPSFFRPDRKCTKDWEFKGYRIKKGTEVYVAMWALHHNPEFYPDPEVFNPDRFLPENKDNLVPNSFMSFGAGTRQCLGTRLVYEILKIFMLNILKEFKIEKRDDTVWKEYPGNPLFLQMDPIYLDFVRR